MDLIVEHQLVGREIQVGENPIFAEQIVGNRRLLEKLLLNQFALLPVADEHEVELGGEGVLVGILVKARDERVGPGFIEHQAGA